MRELGFLKISTGYDDRSKLVRLHCMGMHVKPWNWVQNTHIQLSSGMTWEVSWKRDQEDAQYEWMVWWGDFKELVWSWTGPKSLETQKLLMLPLSSSCRRSVESWFLTRYNETQPQVSSSLWVRQTGFLYLMIRFPFLTHELTWVLDTCNQKS